MGDTVQPPDWEAIARSPEFQELVSSRKRFAWTWGTIGIGLGVLYIVLAGVSHDLMGTELIGSMSIGFAGGVGLIVLTWAITLAYVLRSNNVWGPQEERIRTEFAPPPPAPATEETR